MLFALLLTLYLEDDSVNYAVMTGMEGSTCIVMLQHQQPLLEKTFHPEDFQLSCVIDNYIQE